MPGFKPLTAGIARGLRPAHECVIARLDCAREVALWTGRIRVDELSIGLEGLTRATTSAAASLAAFGSAMEAAAPEDCEHYLQEEDPWHAE